MKSVHWLAVLVSLATIALAVMGTMLSVGRVRNTSTSARAAS
jgi:hypothetical protein